MVVAFSNSLHVVFLAAVPIALLTLPLVIPLKELPLREEAYMKSTTMASVGGEVATWTPWNPSRADFHWRLIGDFDWLWT